MNRWVPIMNISESFALRFKFKSAHFGFSLSVGNLKPIFRQSPQILWTEGKSEKLTTGVEVVYWWLPTSQKATSKNFIYAHDLGENSRFRGRDGASHSSTWRQGELLNSQLGRGTATTRALSRSLSKYIWRAREVPWEEVEVEEVRGRIDQARKRRVGRKEAFALNEGTWSEAKTFFWLIICPIKQIVGHAKIRYLLNKGSSRIE